MEGFTYCGVEPAWTNGKNQKKTVSIRMRAEKSPDMRCAGGRDAKNPDPGEEWGA